MARDVVIPRKACCLQALRLPQDLPDEDCAISISRLISLAATEQPLSASLKDIHDAITRYDCVAYLEPLDVLPTLLPCSHDCAADLIRLIARHNSPKEVMIVLQEEIEHVQTRLDHDDDAEEENDPKFVQRTIGIVLLCAPAISRSRLGKRLAIDVCSPVLEKMAPLIASVAPLSTKEQGRMLITEVGDMVNSLSVWASEVADTDGLQEIKGLLRELLDTTVVSCAASIQASLAVRAATAHFPKHFVQCADEEWRGGEYAMSVAERALGNLRKSPETDPCKPNSFSDVIYLAHAISAEPPSPSLFSDLYQLLVSALQMNMVVDEALYLLFTFLVDEQVSISPEMATSLCTVFTALASTHLDPTIRQLNLRLLALTSSRLPSPARLEILLKLTTDEDFPQIRGPAVGLVKEAVLEALALPPDHAPRNLFASPELLRIFGDVLFRPNPPEFFSERKTRDELAQSLELLRIADCLSFYYVLLQRDGENKTGVRSQDNVTGVQRSILGPLRQFLDEHTSGEEQPLMALLSLEVGLDRIDCALRRLDLKRDT